LKVALITDQHFGARNDSPIFLDFYQKFYDEIFFPKLKQEKVDAVLILGDTFDRRKYMNFYTLKRAKEMFFEPLAQLGVDVHILAGNHDTYFKNTNDVNSVDLLLNEYGVNFNVIDHPEDIYVGPHKICMMPWICAENYESSMRLLQQTDASICCGHFEIDGFQMYRGMPAHEGLKRDLFRKFDFTFSGHYHHKSNADSIFYLGNPYQLTWQDYGDNRGFHIFDLDKRNLEFVENTNVIFHRITYDDKAETIKEIDGKDLTGYKNCYIKVVVMNKTNPYLFDKFMNNLYNVNPADITIVEDFSELGEGLEDEMVDQAEDTLTILGKYIDSVEESNIDNVKLKKLMKELYVEALNTDV